MAVCTIDRSSASPQDSESEDLGSLSSREGFVCREGCVFSLSPRPGVSVGKHGAMPLRIMSHLKKVVKLIRPQDSLKLAVELEQNTPRKVCRYMSLISTLGLQDTEEAIILGTEQQKDRLLICLVLPLLRDTEIKLNGDGGFSVHSYDKQYNFKQYDFKPCSVQSMWTVLQSMFKAIEQARAHNYFVGGLSHTWMTYYRAQLSDDGVALNEWSMLSDVESFRPDSPLYFESKIGDYSLMPSEKESFRNFLVAKLREIMLNYDLDAVTSKQLRLGLEEELKIDLKEYRGYLDQQMLLILGQMEKPSKIHDYLYLGSEWNAADLDGLKELGIGYILNITKEVDNFYPEVFKYKSIKLFDVPQSELLMHWESTYNFIKEAKEANSKVLVHCRMGISRSASTTMAYTMKEYRMSLDEAFKHVKTCRSIVNPNYGFMSQLKAYEGILTARYNKVFGQQVPSRITYQNRSSSDGNIRQQLFVGDQIEGGYCDQDENGLRDLQIDLELENKAVNTLPPEKVHGMMNYLASLPVPEDDQDLGIMVPSPSESGSPFSSPLLTPPDIEGMQLMLKDFQDAEKERLEKAQEIKDNLSVSHTHVNRTVSLPTSIHPLSCEAYPRNISETDKGVEEEPILEEQTPEVEVTITLTQSVTDRVREIEKKNSSLRTERPASAGSRKHLMSGGVSLASSEESLFKRVSNSIDNSLQKDKQRSTSPERYIILEDITPKNEDVSSPLTIATLSPHTPSCTRISTETRDFMASRGRSETPPTLSHNDTDSIETDSLLLGTEIVEDNSSSLPDPAKTYELAKKQSLLLAEIKKNKSNAAVSPLAEESSTRGVKELRKLFGERKRKKSSLKRTQSLKERVLTSPIGKHTRSPSTSSVILKSPPRF